MNFLNQSPMGAKKRPFTYKDQATLKIRSGIILDRGRGRIIQWYGLLVPMKRTEYLMDSIRQVEMNLFSGDSDSELEDLVAPTIQGVMNTIEVPGIKKVPRGNTGSPRMPDGRPVPAFSCR